jgi:hypothetical protein
MLAIDPNSPGPRARRVLAITLVFVAAALPACGAGPGEEPAVDAAASDLPDAGSPPPDAGPCTKPQVFINTLLPDGETFIAGSDSSALNRSTLLGDTVQLGPMAADPSGTVITARALLEPLGIQVTDVDPGSVPHIEIVLVGSGWPFDAGYAALAPGYCMLRPNAIAMVNAFPGRTAADLAASIAYTLGIINGLELAELQGNCMSLTVGATCTFNANAPTTQPPRCAGAPAIQDQIAILQQNLACP